MHNFQANYDKILEILNQLSIPTNHLFQIRTPKLSDKELIIINLTLEYMSLIVNVIYIRVLPIERSVYNLRIRKLFEFQELVRQKISVSFYVLSSKLNSCKLII